MNNEIENISDQLDGYMEDVYKKIEKIKKEKELTREEAMEIAKIAVEDIKADVLWKRLDKISDELRNIYRGL